MKTSSRSDMPFGFSPGAPKKGLGQNFLLHRQIAERIVMVSEVSDMDTVLEIGPGKGMLTRELLAKAGKVVAVEADEELIPLLQEQFSAEIAAGKLELIEGDVRKYTGENLPAGYTLVANIPYYITGEIIRQFLTAANKPASITILVQKEVAERIARITKQSILSLSVRTFGTPKYQFTVPRGAFFPAPNVDSAVLSITNIASPFADSHEEDAFFAAVHAGFAHKRKLLARNLEALAAPEKIAEAFRNAKIDPKIRAEDVPLEAWQVLARELSS